MRISVEVTLEEFDSFGSGGGYLRAQFGGDNL